MKYKLIDDSNNIEESKIVQYGYLYSTNTSELNKFLSSIIKKG